MSPSLINCLRIVGVVVVISLLLVSMAEPLFADQAAEGWKGRKWNRGKWLKRWRHWKQRHCGPKHKPESVPEITLGEAGAAGALLVGSVLIITDRMRRRRFVLKTEA